MTSNDKHSSILPNAKNKQRITLFVNPFLLTHARAQAVVEGKSLTSLVEKALIKYLPKETIIKKADIGTEFET